MTQDAMLARAAALLARALEEQVECRTCEDVAMLPSRLELDILAWLDAARTEGKDGV